MYFVNVVHESLLGLLKGFVSSIALCRRLYDLSSSIGGVFRFPFAIVPRSAGLALFYKLLQLAFLDQFFYLLLQVFAILGVVAMVFMEMVIFPLVSYIR